MVKYIKRVWHTIILPFMFLYGQIFCILRETSILRQAIAEVWRGEADHISWMIWALDDDEVDK